MKTFRNQNFLIHHQIPIDFRNMGGAMESLLRGPKIQGVLVAARNPHHPGKVAGSPRLPQVPQVDTGGGSQDPMTSPRPPPPLEPLFYTTSSWYLMTTDVYFSS